MPTKSIFKSKTFWLNIIGIAAPLVVPSLANSHPAVYTGVMAGLNIANRFLTDQPVNLTGN